jgi:hypothetical protein
MSTMQPWPDHRLLDLLKLEIPILQGPMAGHGPYFVIDEYWT